MEKPCRWVGDSVGWVTFQYIGLEASKIEGAEQKPSSVLPSLSKPEMRKFRNIFNRPRQTWEEPERKNERDRVYLESKRVEEELWVYAYLWEEDEILIQSKVTVNEWLFSPRFSGISVYGRRQRLGPTGIFVLQIGLWLYFYKNIIFYLKHSWISIYPNPTG